MSINITSIYINNSVISLEYSGSSPGPPPTSTPTPNPTPTPAPTPTPNPTPTPAPDTGGVKYRGVNLCGYDMGNMTGKDNAAGLCTDKDHSTGGWIDYGDTVPDVGASPYIVGGAGYAKQPGSPTKGSPLNPASPGDSYWATSYPQKTQIDNAITAGVNIFRLPFMPTFMDSLTTGWAKNTLNDIYISANKKYIDFYMTTLDYIVQKKCIVIFDNHVYQRWCPTNIPGTAGCLEIDGSQLSMDKTTDIMCPYTLDQDGIDYFKNNIETEWDEPDFSYIKGNSDNASEITDDKISNIYCQNLTDSINTADTDQPTYSPLPPGCSTTDKDKNKCYGGPTKRVIGIDCSSVMWYNILKTSFTIVDDSKQQTIEEYIKKNSEYIWIGLMNEPNKVNTRAVGRAYAKTFKLLRSMNITNTLLVEGNYWAGLHAQITPSGDTKGNISRPGAESEGWVEESDKEKPPCQIILEELKNLNGSGKNDLGSWKYDVHQYVDINSTGIHSCIDGDSKVSTLDDMKFMTNFEPFEKWAVANDIRVFVSEFGAQIGTGNVSAGCDKRLNLFIQMIEESTVIDGWTIWRNSPAVTWATPTNVDWTNSVQFGPVNPTTAKTITFDGVSTWENLYNNDKEFTDINSKTHSMPQLWELKGGSSSKIDFGPFTLPD